MRLSDEYVENQIAGTLRKSAEPLRRNKLRKLVCQSSPGTTWTQFASCLDRLISEGKVNSEENDQVESMVHLNNRMLKDEETQEIKLKNRNTTSDRSYCKCSDSKGKGSENYEKRKTDYSRWSELCITVKIPPAIAMHLTRNKRAKLNNIEQNTKTDITIVGWGGSSEKRSLKSDKPADMLTVTIEPRREDTNSQKASRNEKACNDDENAAKRKRLKFAVHLVQSMVQSFKEHPDHFFRKRKNPTEQDEHKNQEAAPHEKRKRSKFY